MSKWKKPHTYSYYDYIHKYESRFLNKYQSNTHWVVGRGTHYLEMLRLKAWRMKGNRDWHHIDYRLGPRFHLMIQLPLFFLLTGSMLLAPAWRKIDERYFLRYGDGEDDSVEEREKLVHYQSRKKPLTRRKFSNAVKIVYDDREDYDYIPLQPQRYR